MGRGCRTRADESGGPHISRKCSDVEWKWAQKICSSQVHDVMLTYHFRRSPYQRVSLSPHIQFFCACVCEASSLKFIYKSSNSSPKC